MPQLRIRILAAGLALAAVSILLVRPALTQSKPATTTTLTLVAGPLPDDPETSPWVLRAVVAPVDASTELPLGAVEFLDDTTVLGRAALIPTENGIVATLGVAAFQPGVHTLVARYHGSVLFAGSESAPVVHAASGQ